MDGKVERKGREKFVIWLGVVSGDVVLGDLSMLVGTIEKGSG